MSDTHPPAEEQPEPAAVEPKPAEEQLKPAAEEPKPGAEETKPTEVQPKPVVEESKPAAEQPKPAEEPKHAKEQPKPAAEEPKPTEEPAKPAADEPAKPAEEPKPAAEQPAAPQRNGGAAVPPLPLGRRGTDPFVEVSDPAKRQKFSGTRAAQLKKAPENRHRARSPGERGRGNSPPPGPPAAAQSAPSPTIVHYRTTDEKISALEQDNEVLRLMLVRQRSSGVNLQLPQRQNKRSLSPNSSAELLLAEIQKKKKLVEAERDKRILAEELATSEKESAVAQLNRRDIEIRKLHDQLQHARNDLASARARLKEEEGLVAVLRGENTRLVNCLKAHNINPDEKWADGPPSYLGSAKAERIRKEVPSARHFSAALRSFSPILNSARPHAPIVSVFGVPGGKKSHEVSSSVQSNDGSKQAALMFSGTSPNPASAQRAPPSGTPKPVAPPLASRSRSPMQKRLADYKVGSRVTWRGAQGIVRYVGSVHGLGDSTWVGVELSQAGAGEHNGSLSGIKYFSASPKSGVFCSMSELLPPKEYNFAAPLAAA